MQQECNISIITVNYNGLKDTCELLDRLPLEDPTLEVIVVDNASKNDEATILCERYPLAKIIRSNYNLGFAGGNNLGIIEARGRYLFFLNNDTLIDDVERGVFGEQSTYRYSMSEDSLCLGGASHSVCRLYTAIPHHHAQQIHRFW